MARRYNWGSVVVVSDGLGSKAHSDHGSKAACLSVLEGAKVLHTKPDARPVDILRLIHSRWLVEIAPYSPKECSATCLFAIQMEDNMLLSRLGDGMIAVVGENEKNGLVMTDSKGDSFSNQTNCLQRGFDPGEWEVSSIGCAGCDAVLLCTDGISDDLLPERRQAFAHAVHSTYATMAPRTRKRDINRWLADWPVPGHSDDKTIVCLFRNRGPQ